MLRAPHPLPGSPSRRGERRLRVCVSHQLISNQATVAPWIPGFMASALDAHELCVDKLRGDVGDSVGALVLGGGDEQHRRRVLREMGTLRGSVVLY